MLKRALITTSIVVILLAGWAPAESACGLGDAVPHECCMAVITPEASQTCCSDHDEPAPPANAGPAIGCICDHPASTPGAILAAAGSITPDENGIPLQEADLASCGSSGPSGNTDIQRRVRSHPPPPAYLLNAAFLN